MFQTSLSVIASLISSGNPHLRKNTRKRILEFRFDSSAAASSSPHLTLPCSAPSYTPYRAVEPLPGLKRSRPRRRTPQLETTSLTSSSMSSNSPTEVFTTSNVFLDVLVKAGITHAFVKYVYLLAISSSNAANLPPFSASDPITLLYWKLSYQGRSTSYRLSRSSRVQMR